MKNLIRFLGGSVRRYHLMKRLLMAIFASFLTLSMVTAQQTGTITGYVKDTKGQPLEATSVTIAGTSQGVLSDSLGGFKIRAVKGDTLIFSRIGYNDLTRVVTDVLFMEVTLVQSQEHALNDVVVVGYGTSTKKTLVNSVSVVEGTAIVKSPQPDVSNALAGRFSGLIASNRTGEPGYDGSSISIRGRATTGNNDVLVVVDGVPGAIGGFSRLNPNDIESITVLKDASAAVYGSRAANGVILVTTKKGKMGKPMISYSFNQGFSSPTRLPEMADAATFATILNEIDYYNNPDGGLNQHYSEQEIEQFRDGSDPINYPNTDWQQAVLKSVALQNHHSLSVRGGTQKVQYYMSVGTVSQNSLYKNGATKYHQYNVRANLGAQITDDLKVNLALSGRQEDRRFPIASAGDIFRSIYRAYPTVIDRYPNGLPSTGIENNNPVVMATSTSGWNRNPTSTFNGVLSATYDIPFLKGLSLDGFFAVDKSFNFTKTFNQPYPLYHYDAATDAYLKTIAGGSAGAARLDESQVNSSLITQNIKLNYKEQWGVHHLEAFVGYEQSENRSETFGASRINYPTILTPELTQGGAAATDKDNYGSSFNFTRRSVISRLAYNYDEKYLLEGQLRVDGSSNFPKGHQYGYFPSVAVGWRLSEESWFKNSVSWVNDLKLRASYGELGNDNVGQFQYYNNYSFANHYVIGNNNVHPGIDLIKLANPNITWEVARKLDVGLNAIIVRNFNLELIYFQQKRTDILTARNASIPWVSGIVNPFNGNPLVPDENIGKVNNQGFEATVGYTHSGPFHFNVSANLTYAKSKVIFVDEAAGVLDYQSETGHPLNSYLLYKAIGIYRTAEDLDKYPHVTGAGLGDLILEDYNGDGKITADDQIRTRYGNIPQIVYGLVFDAGYKQFDFSFVISGQAKVSQYVLPESGQVGNFYSSWADNRWSPTNPGGSYPKVDTRSSAAISGGLYNSTFWLNNAAFLRLKNLEVGYTLPRTLLNQIKISSVRVYANAANLFTITKVKDYDPEGDSGSGQFYPQQRIINLGVTVNF